MLQLQLSVATVTSPAGSLARLTDQTDWSTALGGRAGWALFTSATRLGSLAAQDTELAPFSYEAHLFQSGANPAGTVDLVLPLDGVYRLRTVAVPVVADTVALAAALAGNVYYQLSTAGFYFKNLTGATSPVLTWADVLSASATQLTLLDGAVENYVRTDFTTQAGLALLNLRYLEASRQQRHLLLDEYVAADLLLSGSAHQFDAGFYADAATSFTAVERLLGACLPAFAQSLPALSATCPDSFS